MGLKLTERAVKELKEINLSGKLYLRISFDAASQFHTALESKIYSGDTVIHESDEAKVVLDQWADKKLNGFIFDFSDEKKEFYVRKEGK